MGRSHRRWIGTPARALCLLATAGCQGLIGLAGEPRATADAATARVDDDADTGPAAMTASAPSSRVPRLSRTQWTHSVTDLLRLGDETEARTLAATFTGDPPPTGTFDNNGGALVVTPGLWSDYQNAAEALAADVANDATKIARLMPADLPTDHAAQAQLIVQTFLARAFRRPPSSDEVAAYVALFDQGPTFFPSNHGYAGWQILLQAALQSPDFVYRVETASTVVDGRMPRSPYELASRLSYALWNTMPDDALFAAAASGSLGTAAGLRAQALRLLADPRAHATIQDFHDQLFQTANYNSMITRPAGTPGFSAAVPAALIAESRQFVDAVVFGDRGGFGALITSPYTFVNSDLAPAYGLDPSGFTADAFRRVALDASQRAGWLTHAGFLMLNGSSTAPDSILRGAFVNRSVLCAELPPPPPTATPLPAPVPDQTNRQAIEAHTGTCGVGCHTTLINPAGFAFEHFDGAAHWQTTDHGQPIDATGTYRFDGTPRAFDGAVQFSQLVAASHAGHACYARHWLEYTFGRPPADADAALVAQLGEASRTGNEAVLDLIVALVTSDGFVARDAEGN